jgi:hypothetical protein
MSDTPLVNDQIVDSVTGVVTLLSGNAPSQAFSMLDTVLVETIGMAMYNAVNRQQNSGMTGNAAVTAACAKMLAVPFPLPPPPPSPPPSPAPQIAPLPGPAGSNPIVAEAVATAQAEAGIAWLKQLVQQSVAETTTANAALAQLAVQATAPAPAPPPELKQEPPPEPKP